MCIGPITRSNSVNIDGRPQSISSKSDEQPLRHSVDSANPQRDRIINSESLVLTGRPRSNAIILHDLSLPQRLQFNQLDLKSFKPSHPEVNKPLSIFKNIGQFFSKKGKAENMDIILKNTKVPSDVLKSGGKINAAVTSIKGLDDVSLAGNVTLFPVQTLSLLANLQKLDDKMRALVKSEGEIKKLTEKSGKLDGKIEQYNSAVNGIKGESEKLNKDLMECRASIKNPELGTDTVALKNKERELVSQLAKLNKPALAILKEVLGLSAEVQDISRKNYDKWMTRIEAGKAATGAVKATVDVAVTLTNVFKTSGMAASGLSQAAKVLGGVGGGIGIGVATISLGIDFYKHYKASEQFWQVQNAMQKVQENRKSDQKELHSVADLTFGKIEYQKKLLKVDMGAQTLALAAGGLGIAGVLTAGVGAAIGLGVAGCVVGVASGFVAYNNYKSKQWAEENMKALERQANPDEPAHVKAINESEDKIKAYCEKNGIQVPEPVELRRIAEDALCISNGFYAMAKMVDGLCDLQRGDWDKPDGEAPDAIVFLRSLYAGSPEKLTLLQELSGVKSLKDKSELNQNLIDFSTLGLEKANEKMKTVVDQLSKAQQELPELTQQEWRELRELESDLARMGGEGGRDDPADYSTVKKQKVEILKVQKASVQDSINKLSEEIADLDVSLKETIATVKESKQAAYEMLKADLFKV